MSKTFQKRKPWNAFPMATLSVRGISACAADVLRYLAIRSNYLGETVVGQRRMREDMARSKDYVTRGLAELEEKKLIHTVGRNRAGKQADRHVISASILSPEEQELLNKHDPDKQEDDVPNSPVQVPDRQEEHLPDFGSHLPDRQDETLQKEPSSTSPNLTEENLTQKQGRKERRNEVSTSSIGLSIPVVQQEGGNQSTDNAEEDQEQEQHQDQPPVLAPLEEDPTAAGFRTEISDDAEECCRMFYTIKGAEHHVGDMRLMQDLLDAHGMDDVYAIIMDCAGAPGAPLFLHKIGFYTIKFFCDQFPLTLRKWAQAKRTDEERAEREQKSAERKAKAWGKEPLPEYQRGEGCAKSAKHF